MTQKKKSQEQATLASRPTSVVRRDQETPFSAVPASALTDIPVPQLDLGELTAAAKPRVSRHESLASQIPTGDLYGPPVQQSQALSAKLGRAWDEVSDRVSSFFNDEPPTPLAAASTKPELSGGEAFNQSRTAAQAASLTRRATESTSAESEGTAPEVVVKTTRMPRQTPAREPDPQVQVRPDPAEVVKSMNPVTVVERAQLSEQGLDAAQRTAFAIRQVKDGKESAFDAVARIEKGHGAEAARQVQGHLEALGIDTREGATAPGASTLRTASEVSDAAVLASFRDFREQRNLAAALPDDVREAAVATLNARKAETAIAAAAKDGAGTEKNNETAGVASGDRDAQIEAATQWLHAKAEAVGLSIESLDQIAVTELLDTARNAPPDTVVTLNEQREDGSVSTVSFNAGEMLDASRGMSPQQQGQAAKEKDKEEPVQVAQAEMEMGD